MVFRSALKRKYRGLPIASFEPLAFDLRRMPALSA